MSSAAVSLLEASPSLARVLRSSAPLDLLRLPLLPLRAIRESERAPSEPGVALIVYAGLLASEEGLMAGPGDVIADPAAGWTACTGARVAIVGPLFQDAAAPWPDVLPTLLGRALTRPAEPSAGGALEERLEALLWRVAGLWGAPDGNGMALALALDTGAFARLLRVSDDEAAATVASLTGRGAIARRSDGGWKLQVRQTGDAPHARRDELRARGAQQLALARQAVEDYAELSERIREQVLVSVARRSR